MCYFIAMQTNIRSCQCFLQHTHNLILMNNIVYNFGAAKNEDSSAAKSALLFLHPGDFPLVPSKLLLSAFAPILVCSFAFGSPSSWLEESIHYYEACGRRGIITS